VRTAVSTLELREPRSLRDALVMLDEEPGLIPLAAPPTSSWRSTTGPSREPASSTSGDWAALRRISLRGDVLSIGALATFTSIARSRAVRARAPMLAAAALQVGGIQIQNRGTIGGNIANGSPAGDSLPVLSALDAQVVLKSSKANGGSGSRVLHRYRQSVRRADELIIAVEIDARGQAMVPESGTRAAQAISKVVMAGVRAPRPRLAIGSVGATVIRLERVEAALAAGRSVDEAVEILEQEISPIDDLRSSMVYRRRVAGNLLRRFWEDTSK
jgi:CO/xanthine dehydrogenase FAD-binding subunit